MANSNMKKTDIPRCLQKWYGHHFGCLKKWYGCSFDIIPREDVESFIQDYKRWMRRRFSDFTITFIDGGMPYDPLAKEDPDVTMPAEDRQIGGLGVFMVKKTMDDVAYEYRDGQNILTLKKNL